MCPVKRIPDIFSCNLRKYCRILIIWAEMWLKKWTTKCWFIFPHQLSVLDGRPDPLCKEANVKGKSGDPFSAVSCAEMGGPIWWSVRRAFVEGYACWVGVDNCCRFRSQPPKNYLWVWIGVLKPNAQKYYKFETVQRNSCDATFSPKVFEHFLFCFSFRAVD